MIIITIAMITVHSNYHINNKFKRWQIVLFHRPLYYFVVVFFFFLLKIGMLLFFFQEIRRDGEQIVFALSVD